jgi:hypothetical protein
MVTVWNSNYADAVAAKLGATARCWIVSLI